MALARSVFGDSVNYSKVDAYSNPFSARSVTLGFANDILFGSLESDFSKAPLPAQGEFIHEMTHIAQSQHGVFTTIKGFFLHVGAAIKGFFKGLFGAGSSASEDRALYDLSPGKALSEHNIEGQAQAVQNAYEGRKNETAGKAMTPEETAADKAVPAFPIKPKDLGLETKDK